MSNRDQDEANRPLSFAERLIFKFMVAGQKAQFGFSHPFLENLVRTSGVKGSLAFMRIIPATIGAMEKMFGPLLGNLIMAFTALWNGCPYCGVGHLYAANVLYFQATGLLYPIAEHEIYDLQRMTYEDLLAYVRKQLTSDEHIEHMRVIDRLFQIYNGETPTNDEDKVLSAAIGSWGWLNECSIPVTYDLKLEEIPVMLPAKNREAMVARYRAARDTYSKRGDKI